MYLHIFHTVKIIKNTVIPKSAERSLRDLFGVLTRFVKSMETYKLFVITHNYGIDRRGNH